MLVIDGDAQRGRAGWSSSCADTAPRRSSPQRASAGLGLAREHEPEAVLVAGESQRDESPLAALKKHPDTRHVPVVVVGDRPARLDALRAGAAAFVEEPGRAAEFDRALARVARLTETPARRVAVVSDDAGSVRPGHGRARERRRDRPQPDRFGATRLGALRTGSYDFGVVRSTAAQIGPARVPPRSGSGRGAARASADRVRRARAPQAAARAARCAVEVGGHHGRRFARASWPTAGGAVPAPGRADAAAADAEAAGPSADRRTHRCRAARRSWSTTTSATCSH